MSNNEISKFGDTRPSDLFVAITGIVHQQNKLNYGIPIPESFCNQFPDACTLHQSDIDQYVDTIYDEVRTIHKQNIFSVGINLANNRLSVAHSIDCKLMFYKSIPISGDFSLNASHTMLADTYMYLKSLKA